MGEPRETDDRVILRRRMESRLSWEETYRSMATDGEDWSDFEGTSGDGLDRETPAKE